MTIAWLPGFLSLPDDPVPFEAETFSLTTLLRDGVQPAAETLKARLGPSDGAIGYSMGGRLLLHAIASGVTPRAAVFLSTSPGLEDPHEREQRRDLDAARAARLREDPPAFLRAWAEEPVFSASRASAAWRAQQERRATLSRIDAEAWARVLVAMSPGTLPSLWDMAIDLPCPSLWIAGELDLPYARIAERVARTSRRASVHILPNVGHALPLEAPAEVRKLVGRFLIERLERERISP